MRDKNGGIQLARAPKDINLGILIKQIELDFALVECFATQLSNNDHINHDNYKEAKTSGLPLTVIDE